MMDETVTYRPHGIDVSAVTIDSTVDQRTGIERITSFLCRPLALLGIAEICPPRLLHIHGTSDADGILRDQLGRVCGEVRSDGTLNLWPPADDV